MCKTVQVAEVESRTQGLRPRTQKKSKAKDSLSKDRNARGQGPRTQAQVLSKKKRSSQKFFRQSPQKNVFQKIFQALHKIFKIQKIVLSLSRGQANFRGLEASRPRTSKCVLKDSTSAKSYCYLNYIPCYGFRNTLSFTFASILCVMQAGFNHQPIREFLFGCSCKCNLVGNHQ